MEELQNNSINNNEKLECAKKIFLGFTNTIEYILIGIMFVTIIVAVSQ